MIDKEKLMIENTELLVLLKKSGWSEQRKINRNKTIKMLESEGYQPFDKVVDFLSQFEGITILFHNEKNGLKNDDISFDYYRATQIEVPERILNTYVPRIKKSLCLIGSAYREHFVLMMSEDGNVYGGYDHYLCKISNSGIGAIEAIILDKDFIEIP